MELKRLEVYHKEYRESSSATIEKGDAKHKEIYSAYTLDRWKVARLYPSGDSWWSLGADISYTSGGSSQCTPNPVPGIRRMITPSAVRTAT
jgi:hypothetical protein